MDEQLPRLARWMNNVECALAVLRRTGKQASPREALALLTPELVEHETLFAAVESELPDCVAADFRLLRGLRSDARYSLVESATNRIRQQMLDETTNSENEDHWRSF